MPGVLKWFENLRFRRKMIVVFIMAVTFSLTVSLSALTAFSIKILKQSSIANLELLTKLASDNFERKMSDLETQLFNMINMLQVTEYVQKLNEENSRYDRQQLNYIVNQLVSSLSPFDFVYLKTRAGYTANTAEKLEEPENAPIGFCEAFSKRIGEAPLKTGYLWASDAQGDVYILHQIRSISTLEYVGDVVVRIKAESLKIFNFEMEEKGNCFLLYNKNRDCIYLEGVPENLQLFLRDQIKNKGDISGNQVWEHKHYYAFDEKGPEWSVVGMIPMSGINQMRWGIIVVGIMAGMLSLFLGGFLLYYLTRKVSKQLFALTNSICRVSQGGLDTVTPVYIHDDVGELAEHFNDMNRQINALMKKIVYQERLKNQAELEALEYRYRFLQTQINPHFIYNALETVNAIAKIHKAPEISRMLQLIGKYFRGITANSDKQFVELKEAFESVRIYTEIYHYIQEINLQTDIILPKELERARIPTMILQPIVENCFVHGMKDYEALFMIRVSARKEKDQIIIRIEDNGTGLEASAGEQLLQAKKAHLGIGLSNIIERLSLLYGDNGGLRIENREKGTAVTIWIPFEEME